MSDDEVFVTIASLALTAIAWGVWYVQPRRVRAHRRRVAGRWLLDVAPLLSAAVLFLVLKGAAADDVRNDSAYMTLYFLLGMAWVGVSLRCLPLLGLSVRDDVLERGNAGASYAVAGAMLAITLCYAGGNVGNGPGWWVVVFSAALATAALFVAWFLFESMAWISDVITIDRDTSAGIRLGGLLVACGAIFGRAVAGDWVSAAATVGDFASVAWFALVLVALAALVERAARPTPERPTSPTFAFGLVPAVLYIVAAVWQVVSLGPAA